jgi:hypothetical protein
VQQPPHPAHSQHFFFSFLFFVHRASRSAPRITNK